MNKKKTVILYNWYSSYVAAKKDFNAFYSFKVFHFDDWEIFWKSRNHLKRELIDAKILLPW
jgi:hypothetical protein